MVLSILITFLLGKYRWYREKVVGYHVGELRKISWRWFVLPFYKRVHFLFSRLKRTLAHSDGGFPTCKQKFNSNIWKGTHFSLSWKFPWSCWFFSREKKNRLPRKNSRNKARTVKNQPTYRSQIGLHKSEASARTTTPTLFTLKANYSFNLKILREKWINQHNTIVGQWK